MFLFWGTWLSGRGLDETLGRFSALPGTAGTKQNMTKAEYYLPLMDIVLHVLSTIRDHRMGEETEAVS